MAFKMNGPSMHMGTAAHKTATAAYKKTWKEAYQDRDMDAYGDMSESEYIEEAKRQKEVHSKTGKWDVGGKSKKTTNTKADSGESSSDTSEGSGSASADAKQAVKDARQDKKQAGKDAKDEVMENESGALIGGGKVKAGRAKKEARDEKQIPLNEAKQNRRDVRDANLNAFKEAKAKWKEDIAAWKEGGKEGSKPERPKRRDFMRR